MSVTNYLYLPYVRIIGLTFVSSARVLRVLRVFRAFRTLRSIRFLDNTFQAFMFKSHIYHELSINQRTEGQPTTQK